MRRALWETLVELAGAAHPAGDALGSLRITGIVIDVPIEVRMQHSGSEWELLADLPQWRWQTGLEELPGRLHLQWAEGGPS